MGRNTHEAKFAHLCAHWISDVTPPMDLLGAHLASMSQCGGGGVGGARFGSLGVVHRR
eukprot:SAG31_NODE_929_length_10926_cov_8.162834_3_plen_58_part_00